MSDFDRRRLLQMLAAAGVLSAADAGALQSRTELTLEILEKAQNLLDQGFDDERLGELLPAIQRNLDFFQIVRDEDIDGLIEPAPLFRARGR